MKLKLKNTLALLVGCTTILGMGMETLAADGITYDEINQVDDVNQVYESVNEFRTAGNAWYWDESGNRVECGSLPELSYNYGLEEIAQIRAEELTTLYAHERPDGSSFSTCVASDGTQTYGENIAKATGYNDYIGTPDAVFDQWKEEDKDYAGQGHRRNMLSVSNPFTSIGIAHIQAKGSDGTYQDFWVQEFGYTNSSTTPTPPTPPTPPTEPIIPTPPTGSIVPNEPEDSSDGLLNSSDPDTPSNPTDPSDRPLNPSDPDSPEQPTNPSDFDVLGAGKPSNPSGTDEAGKPAGSSSSNSSNATSSIDSETKENNAESVNTGATSQTATNISAPNKAPQTGDNTNFMLSLLGIAVASGVILSLKIKR